MAKLLILFHIFTTRYVYGKYEKYENNEIKFNFYEEDVNYNLLTEIRVFNERVEVKAVLNEETDNFDVSITKDETDSKDYFDEKMFMTDKLYQDGKERRLIVRNYFSTNDDGQVVISKSRLVGIVEGGQ